MSRGYAAIGLLQPKTPHNVGSVLRAAHCYGAAAVIKTGQRYKGAVTDPAKGVRHVPLIEAPPEITLRDLVPYNCVPVAVDLVPQAVDLRGYTHPERAFYVFGPEDGTLGQETLSWCRDVVSIPMTGCMNLAAAVNVVLYDRFLKQLSKEKP